MKIWTPWYRLLKSVREYRGRCPLLPKWEGLPFLSEKTLWQINAACDFPDLRKRLPFRSLNHRACAGGNNNKCVLRCIWVEGVNETDGDGMPIKINIVQARNSAVSSRYRDDKALWEERINGALRAYADTQTKKKWMSATRSFFMSLLREASTSLKKVSSHKYAG